jgi:hypothetical protein
MSGACLALKQRPLSRGDGGGSDGHVLPAGCRAAVTSGGCTAAQDVQLRMQRSRLGLQLRDARRVSLAPRLRLGVLHKVQHARGGKVELAVAQPFLNPAQRITAAANLQNINKINISANLAELRTS